jgi:hypothetical protein
MGIYVIYMCLIYAPYNIMLYMLYYPICKIFSYTLYYPLFAIRYIYVKTTTSERCELALKAGLNSSDFGLWIVDSGATSHMTGDRSSFESFRPTQVRIGVANQTVLIAKGMGNVRLSLPGGRVLMLKNVLYAPGVSHNLLSVSGLCQDGHTVSFDINGCKISKGCDTLVQLSTSKKLYWVAPEGIDTPGYEAAELAGPEGKAHEVLRFWHNRLGHICFAYIAKMFGISSTVANAMTCETCGVCKAKRQPHKGTTHVPTRKLGQVDADLCGPFPVVSLSGKKYFGVIVDRYTRFVSLVFLTRKSEFVGLFTRWLNFMVARYKTVPEKVHTDGGGEFVNKDMKCLLENRGIEFSTTCPDTPNQNPFAERMVGKIQRMVDCMMVQSGAPKGFWAEAANYAGFILNRTPHSSLGFKSPLSMWEEEDNPSHQVITDLGKIRPFGCRAFVRVPGKPMKGQPHGVKGVLVGYDMVAMGYRVWIPHLHKVIRSHDVTFHETVFPYMEKGGVVNDSPVQANDFTPEGETTGYDSTLEGAEPEIPGNNFGMSPDMSQPTTSNMHDTPITSPPKTPTTLTREDLRDPTALSSPPMLEEVIRHRRMPNNISIPSPAINNRPVRVRRPPRDNENFPMLDSGKNKSIDFTAGSSPEKHIDTAKNGRMESTLLSAELSIPKGYNSIPKTSKPQSWYDATYLEVAQVKGAGTYDIIDRQWWMRVIPSHFIYSVKWLGDKIIKHKCRWVAGGDRQTEGVDYNETFATVARMKSFRIILALCMLYGLTPTQLDVSNAYLHGSLKEDVYMSPPRGMTLPPGKVLKLKKCLYGLKQAGREWSEFFKKVLLELDFVPLKSDPCVFKHKTKLAIMSVHVDDILLATDDEEFRRLVVAGLGKRLKIKDEGNVSQYVGVEVEWGQSHVTLHQKGYISRMLDKFRYAECQPKPTPACASVRLTKSQKPATPEEVEHMSRIPYRAAVGSLLYAAYGSRPDISSAVNRAAQFGENPGVPHWKSVQHLFR